MVEGTVTWDKDNQDFLKYLDLNTKKIECQLQRKK